MSIDFNAVVTRPMTLEGLFDTSGSIMAELVGLDTAAVGEVVSGRRRLLGQVVHGGEPVSPEDLAATWIGPGVPDPSVEVLDRRGVDLAQLMVSASPVDWILVVTPARSARGVVAGLSTALAAALLGEGSVVDNDLRIVEGDGTDVAGFVAATRLPLRERPLDRACLDYLRQFPQLKGWPPG